MSIVNTIPLECNKKIKINFNGGDLSSDSGLLLIKEFAAKVGRIKLIARFLKQPASLLTGSIRIQIISCSYSIK